MDVTEYIASGILELYVAGSLSEAENVEVFQNAQKYPEIKQEIEAIEAALLALSKSASPGISREKGFAALRRKIGVEVPVFQPEQGRKTNWYGHLGWAACLLLAAGVSWLYLRNADMKTELQFVNRENEFLQQQIFEARNSLANSTELLHNLRERNIAVVTLGGQEVSPASYAKVYWNRENRKVFVDAQGLPDPPPGMVYQVWSLKMSPLTPTSLGLLEEFSRDENKVFALNNPNESEAFGITLEPEGGSEAPTMSQLYTLGTVAPS